MAATARVAANDLNPLDHEEELLVPWILSGERPYADDCIPLEMKCNVTVVTGEKLVGGRGPSTSPIHSLRSLIGCTQNDNS
jgi:hypothetical protein